MRRPGSTRQKILGLILAIGITVILPYVVVGAGRTSSSSGRLRAPMTRPQHSFVPQRSIASESRVWVKSAKGKSLFISRFSLHRTLNLENLPQTEFSFRHTGWTAGLECRSQCRDTGSSRIEHQRGDRDSGTACRTADEVRIYRQSESGKANRPDYPAERAGAGESSNQVVTRRC